MPEEWMGGICQHRIGYPGGGRVVMLGCPQVGGPCLKRTCNKCREEQENHQLVQRAELPLSIQGSQAIGLELRELPSDHG